MKCRCCLDVPGECQIVENLLPDRHPHGTQGRWNCSSLELYSVVTNRGMLGLSIHGATGDARALCCFRYKQVKCCIGRCLPKLARCTVSVSFSGCSLLNWKHHCPQAAAFVLAYALSVADTFHKTHNFCSSITFTHPLCLLFGLQQLSVVSWRSYVCQYFSIESCNE